MDIIQSPVETQIIIQSLDSIVSIIESETIDSSLVQTEEGPITLIKTAGDIEVISEGSETSFQIFSYTYPSPDQELIALKTSFVTPTELGFWTDIEPGAHIWKIRDRLMVGDSCNYTGEKSYDPADYSWIGATPQPNLKWVEQRAQLCVAQSIGCVAITGASRASDQIAAGLPEGSGCVGVVGIGYTDRPKTTTWAGYFDAKRELGCGNAFGLEIEVCDLGGETTGINPYSSVSAISGVTSGIWLNAGADDFINPLSYHCSCGIHLGSNSKRFKKGIIFTQYTLVADSNGFGTAIEMAKGHQIRWVYNVDEEVGGFLSSEVDDQTKALGIYMRNGAFCLQTPDTLKELFRFNRTGNNVNGISLTATDAGTFGPIIAAFGDDIDIDLRLTPKNNGVLNYVKIANVASVPLNFVPTHYVPLKVNNVLYYLPLGSLIW